MKLKNRISLVLVLFIALISTYAMSGCNAQSKFVKDEVNPAIEVMDVKLYMDEKEVHEKLKSPGEKAMCINGYEYEYSAQKVNVGFDSNTNKVRRITTKNPETSIYEIAPESSLDEAYKILKHKGFAKVGSSLYKYKKENVTFTIISMKNEIVDGVTIEIDPVK